MNGLRFIRRTCNLSANELANILGVTRQTISLWENNKKKIPANRLDQLSDFFGVDKLYFGEINEDQKQELEHKKMFRYKDGEKEYYTFRDTDKKDFMFPVYGYLQNNTGELTLDEKYRIAVKRKKEAISKVEDMMSYYDIPNSLNDKIMAINRGCAVILPLTELMEHMPNHEIVLKIPYWSEICNVMQALLLANDLTTKEDIIAENQKEMSMYDYTEYIFWLADVFKNHQEEVFSDVKKRLPKKRK